MCCVKHTKEFADDDSPYPPQITAFTLRAYEHGPTAMNTPDGRIPGRECCFQRAVDVVPYGG